MPTVTVEGERPFEAAAGTKLVLALEDAGIDVMHRCGGNARCTTCRVQVVAGDLPPMGELERERLAREASLGPDIRLSCQIRIESDLTVRVLNRSSLIAGSCQGLIQGPEVVVAEGVHGPPQLRLGRGAEDLGGFPVGGAGGDEPQPAAPGAVGRRHEQRADGAAGFRRAARRPAPFAPRV